jgi:hypothetical protein
MQMQELFKVRMGSSLKETERSELNRRCEMIENAVRAVLEPLKISAQLKFCDSSDLTGIRWLNVKAPPAVQAALFEPQAMLLMAPTHHADNIEYEFMRRALADLQSFVNRGLWDCADVLTLANRRPTSLKVMRWPTTPDGTDQLVAPDGTTAIFSLVSPTDWKCVGGEISVAGTVNMVGSMEACISLSRDVRRGLGYTSRRIRTYWRPELLPTASEMLYGRLNRTVFMRVRPIFNRSDSCTALQLIRLLDSNT